MSQNEPQRLVVDPYSVPVATSRLVPDARSSSEPTDETPVTALLNSVNVSVVELLAALRGEKNDESIIETLRSSELSPKPELPRGGFLSSTASVEDSLRAVLTLLAKLPDGTS